MKFFKQPKIEPKTREQITQEIENVLNKKDNSPRAKMLRKAAFALKALKTQDEIKAMFIEEYIKKYGELQTGKVSLKELKEQSTKSAQEATASQSAQV